jgi:hypothetical protein
VLPVVLKVDAKNQESQLARKGKVARREVARILGREFLVIEERADELFGPLEGMPGSGECACLLIDLARSYDAQLQGPQLIKRALPEEEIPVNLGFQYGSCLPQVCLSLSDQARTKLRPTASPSNPIAKRLRVAGPGSRDARWITI